MKITKVTSTFLKIHMIWIFRWCYFQRKFLIKEIVASSLWFRAVLNIFRWFFKIRFVSCIH